MEPFTELSRRQGIGNSGSGISPSEAKINPPPALRSPCLMNRSNNAGNAEVEEQVSERMSELTDLVLQFCGGKVETSIYRAQ